MPEPAYEPVMPTRNYKNNTEKLMPEQYIQHYLRQQYHFGSTLKDLFNNTSVNDIIAFIKDTLLYTRI